MQNSYLARPDLTASAVRFHPFTRLRALFFLLVALLGATLPEGRAQTGAVQWTFVTGGPLYSSPAIGSDGTIYFGSRDSKFYAVKPNGSNRWDFAVGAEVWGSPALGADDTIYFGSQDGKLHALRSNGLQVWEFNAGKAISTTPAVGADGSLFVTCTDGKLYALSAAGVEKWEYVAGGDIRSSPAVDADGTIYFGARDKKLHAVNADGSLKWELLTGGDVDASPSIGPGGVIYFGSGDGKLYAVSRAGVKLWEYATGKEVYSSPAVGVDGAVYVGGYDTRFYAITPQGKARWVTPLGYGVARSSAALAADGTLYVGASEGRFFSLSATGTTNWVITTGADISFSSPAIASDGTVYVGSDDGKLYAIKGTTGPAVGAWPMFHRDARRTGDGFVDRALPAGYSPGKELTVKLRALPPAGVGFYVVEDSPPANWQIGVISDDGYFDAANRRVRFGPFTDGLPRLLSYKVTPPQGETGLKQFAGVSAADGSDRLLGGDHVLDLVPAHPADRSPVDNWLTVGELTAYGAAWKRGTAWPTAPNPVPSSYLNRAIDLWQNGEFYALDTNFATAPAWWVSSTNGTNSPYPLPLPAGTLAGNGVAAADMPLSATPGTKFRVTITVAPSTNVAVYAVEDQPPAGWEVSEVDGDGQFDRVRWKVKWGPFFDHLARTNTYWVAVAASATTTNKAVFAGVAAFDGSKGEITGQREVRLDGGSLPSGLVMRELPAGYSPGMKLVVSLRVAPLPNHPFYVVEDLPPAGWLVGQTSDNGALGSTLRSVRFGPFFDGQARVLTYELTPPLSETGVEWFSGTFSVDGIQGVTGGDTSLDLIPVHPADAQPIDSWLTIGEMTAYGAAWKRGTTWQPGPNPIPAAYLTQAIALWQGGEFYVFDTNFAAAPAWWVGSSNGTNSPPPPLPAGTLATNGVAAADMPLSATPGTKFRVTITVTPSTNVAVYAVEDQPPAGWEVSEVDGDGQFDRARWKVKWGPFFDHVARTNTYWVAVAASATTTNKAVFAGAAAFDGSKGVITGQREVRLDGGPLPSGLVMRKLPAGYSPGMKMVVTLQVVPLTNHLFYVVEDLPPAGWLVGQTSDNGAFGSTSRSVRFGPFFDSQARALTYELTPPLSETGVEWFSGTFSVDGIQGVTGGDASLDLIPVHPADAQPIDSWLTIGEMTAYGAAWKRGTTWQPGPNPIPAAYLTRAIDLWRSGEGYRYDTNSGDGPYWWVSTATGAEPPAPYPVPPPPGSIATNGLVTAELPATTPPGRSLTVTLSALPATNVVVYALEDEPPAGWQVSQVNDGGFYDTAQGKVKWGPFFDHAPRDVSYSVQVPSNATGLATFSGTAAFDADQGAVGGARQVVVTSGGTLDSFVSRILPPGYMPGARSVVTLQASPPPGVGYYIVEDAPPPGWLVSQISEHGVYDTGSGTIKFGPFFDGAPRTLTYEVTPPAKESGLRVFDGVSLADDVDGVVVGDSALSLGVLHPADIDPSDSWITIDEMTAYGAAWKRGATWPLTSAPVPTPYLTRAIELWAGGERYGLDPVVTNAPRWWGNLTNAPPDGPIPPGIAPGSSSTKGFARVDLPRLFRQGLPFTVTILVSPGTNVIVYAVEDHPPEGWLVSQVNQNGFYDPWRRKVKWGPFFDAVTRTLSYQVLPPAGAGSIAAFYGGASFDGDTTEFVGRRQIFLEEGGAFVPRFKALSLTGRGAELTMEGAVGEAYGLELSTNLFDWQSLAGVTNTTSLLKYIDTTATNSPMRFYRAFWK